MTNEIMTPAIMTSVPVADISNVLVKVHYTLDGTKNEQTLRFSAKDKYNQFSFSILRSEVSGFLSKRLGWDFERLTSLSIEVLS